MCGEDFVVTRSEVDMQNPSKNGRGQAAKKPCPYCGEKILSVAKKCKHCGEFLSNKEKKGTADNSSNGVLLWLLIPVMVVGVFFAIGGLLMDYVFPLKIMCAVIFGLALALLAGRKGYNRLLWFIPVFLGGIWVLILGLLILCFLPFVNAKSKLPEEQRLAKKKREIPITVILITIALALIVNNLFYWDAF